MKRVIGMFVVATAFFLAAPPAVVAQSEKISIRMAPRPGQTVRLNLAHEINMDISFDAGAMTHKTGALKPDGTLDAC